jgi:hypothetical protein
MAEDKSTTEKEEPKTPAIKKEGWLKVSETMYVNPDNIESAEYRVDTWVLKSVSGDVYAVHPNFMEAVSRKLSLKR